MSHRLACVMAALLLAGGCSVNPPDQRSASSKSPPATQQSAAAQPSHESDAASAAEARVLPAEYAKAVQEQYQARERVPAEQQIGDVGGAPPATRPAVAAGGGVSQEQPASSRPARQGRKPAMPAGSLPDVEWIEKMSPRLTLGPPQDASGPYPCPDPAEPGLKVPTPPAAIQREATEESSDRSPAIADGLAPAEIARPTAAAPATRQATAPATEPLESKLAQLASDYPRDVAAQLDYQLVQLLAGRQVPQLEAIASLPTEDREILAALLDAISNFRNNVRNDDHAVLAQKVRPLVELADRVRAQASLRIPTIALCTRVDSFGCYDPLASHRFLAGHDHTLLVYCEVENFSSKLSSARQWETNLTMEIVVYSEQGKRLWTDKRRAVNDLSRNRRHDFFLVRKIKLPAGLPIGRYFLKVSVSDEQAGRITEASVPMEIADK